MAKQLSRQQLKDLFEANGKDGIHEASRVINTTKNCLAEGGTIWIPDGPIALATADAVDYLVNEHGWILG